jgi:Tol biopolymer transport system component
MKVYINRFFIPILLFLCVTQAFAQFYYIPYYGKNKVQYSDFNWNTYRTEHFKIYHYVDNPKILKYIVEMAESAYAKISQDVKHSLSAEVPIIYYKTYTDFEQTNLLPASEGILGVSEPTLYRVIIYGDMTLDQTQTLIEHELSHIFEFDILFGSPGGGAYSLSYPPGWVMEGWCEYNTHVWDPWSLLAVRDAALNDRIPELAESGNLFSRYPMPRPPDYDFGHAMFEFIEHKFGKEGIREFWSSLKRSPLIGRRNPIKKVFKMSNKQFNHEFKKYLREEFKDFLDRENPEDYSMPLGPEFPMNPYYFAISHAVSPSGDIVAVLTANIRSSDLDIILISTKDGTVIKNITKGYTIQYEYIRYNIDPSEGADISWSPDGDKIAFFGRSGEKYALYIVDPISGKTIKEIYVSYDRPSSPYFYPDSDALLFAAFDNGIHDIYKVDLETEAFLNLTEDDLYEKAPSISPDGKLVAYTIRLDSYDKLFISPLDNLKDKTQLTFGRGNTSTPHFAPDSEEIYFSGDMKEANNIYSLNLKTGVQKRYTDVRTGNFLPIPLPNNPKKIVFSSFNKGALQIFKSDLEGEVEKTVAFNAKLTGEEFERFEPIVSLDINEEKIEAHKGLGKLYLAGRPPIDTYIASDGSIYGGAAISLSDILGDHTFTFMAYQVQSYRSYALSYINQKGRLQYAANLFQYTLFYYLASYYDPFYAESPLYTPRNATATRKMTGAQFSIYYPFSRFYRAEASLGYLNYEEDYASDIASGYGGFWNGNIVSADFALVGETTLFKYPYGPMSGNTFMVSLSQSLPVSKNFLQNTTLQADLRQYLYLGSDFLFALRFKAFASRGKNPYVFYWGGNNDVRSVGFYSIVGNEGWHANLEFRFPAINAAQTIIGQLGPFRGTFFFDLTRAKIQGYPAEIATIVYDDFGNPVDWSVSEAVGSYGWGFQFYFLGLPFHFDFARLITIDDFSWPFKMESSGKYKLTFWIGYDF